MPSSSGPIQARAGEHTFNIERDGETLLVDGVPSDATITRLDEHTVLFMENNEPTVVGVEPQEDGSLIITVHNVRIPVHLKTARDLLLESLGVEAGEGAADREVRAPMPGLVLRVLVEPGDAVEAGQGVAVLEAMKMENELKAPSSGTVAAVHTEAGAAVGKNDLLIELGE